MALVKCQLCGALISDKAPKCPVCSNNSSVSVSVEDVSIERHEEVEDIPILTVPEAMPIRKLLASLRDRGESLYFHVVDKHGDVVAGVVVKFISGGLFKIAGVVNGHLQTKKAVSLTMERAVAHVLEIIKQSGYSLKDFRISLNDRKLSEKYRIIGEERRRVKNWGSTSRKFLDTRQYDSEATEMMHKLLRKLADTECGQMQFYKSNDGAGKPFSIYVFCSETGTYKVRLPKSEIYFLGIDNAVTCILDSIEENVYSLEGIEVEIFKPKAFGDYRYTKYQVSGLDLINIPVPKNVAINCSYVYYDDYEGGQDNTGAEVAGKILDVGINILSTVLGG